MHNHRTLHAAALALVAATCHLAAADIQWGFTAGLGFPSGSLKSAVENRKGFSLGAQAFIDLPGGHAIRPRLDYTRFQGPRDTFAGLTDQVTYQTAGIGADYLYHFMTKAKGAYAIGGLGVARTRGTLFLDIPALGATTTSESVTKAYGRLGAGYQIDRTWGVEAYHIYQRTSSETDWAATFLAFTARF